MAHPAESSIETTRMARAGWGAAAEAVRRNGPRIGTWAPPFVLVIYLGLKDGGYDSIVRGEVGVAVWWIVLVGAALGLLPTSALRRNGWIGLALLAGFALWTGLGIAWSSNAEASTTEFARVAIYLGVFVLALTARKPGDMRRLVNGLASGIAVIASLAVVSRLHPAWLPTEATGHDLGLTRNRLSYPLGYWNGLATLMAMGAPLLLFIAIRGRTIAGRAVAAGPIPAVALTSFLTLSRGGTIEMAVALLVFVALAPRRLAALPTIALAAFGSAILVVAANQRDALSNGLGTSTAHHQGNEIFAVAIVVCSGVALMQVAFALAARHRLVPRVVVPRRISIPVTALVAALVAVVALATGAPGYVTDRWHDFKTPSGAGTGVQRFDSSSGSGRYQT